MNKKKKDTKKGCLLFALQNSRTLRYSWTNNCGRSAAKYAATFGPSTQTQTHHTHTHTHTYTHAWNAMKTVGDENQKLTNS